MPGMNRFPQGGGAKINGLIKNYLVQVGQTISAGDFVNFVTGDITTGTSAVFKSSALGYYKTISAAALSDTKALVVYSADSVLPEAVILTISGATITVGTPVILDHASNYFSIAILSSSKALVSYDNYAAILTISGTTITKGNSVTAGGSYNSLVTLSDSKALLTYSDNNGAAVILSVSSTTITVGAIMHYTSGTIAQSISATALSDTKVLVTYVADSKSNAVVLTISGTTITAGTPVLFWSSYYTYISMVTLSDTKALIIYENGSASGSYGTAVVLTISGTTITIGTAIVFRSAKIGYISSAKLSNTSVLALYEDEGDAGYGKAVILTISGTTITASTPVLFNNKISLWYSAAKLLDTKVLVAYQNVNNSNYGTAMILSIPQLAKLAIASPFDGVAKTSGTAGAAVDIYTL